MDVWTFQKQDSQVEKQIRCTVWAYYQPNIAVELAARLLPVREVLVSIHGPEAGYSAWFFKVRQSKMPRQHLKYIMTTSFQILLKSSQPPLQRHKSMQLENVVK